jgi:hypothetical protein
MAVKRARPSLWIPADRRHEEETRMRALYLYFAEPDEPDHDRSTDGGGSRPVSEGPHIPIQPGAYSRWKANRDRVVAENSAAFRSAIGESALRRPPNPEPAG